MNVVKRFVSNRRSGGIVSSGLKNAKMFYNKHKSDSYSHYFKKYYHYWIMTYCLSGEFIHKLGIERKTRKKIT